MSANWQDLGKLRADPEAPEERPLDWAALRARLQAERELRASLNGHADHASSTWLAAQGSFDPRAAEALFAHCGYGLGGGSESGRSHLLDVKHSGLMTQDQPEEIASPAGDSAEERMRG